MTVLCSIDCHTLVVRRYDASLPEGLTHVGGLQTYHDSDVSLREVIENFRVNPPPHLRVNPPPHLRASRQRLMPAPAEHRV